MKLTDSQLQAIAHDHGNLQIIACAGSGKTEVVRYIFCKLRALNLAQGFSGPASDLDPNSIRPVALPGMKTLANTSGSTPPGAKHDFRGWKRGATSTLHS